MINLGCGRKYIEGYINCDIAKSIKADKYFDLNKFPYPFSSGSADEILLDNVMEHLGSIPSVMEELHRILKHKGLLRIYVPYAKSDGAFQDPTHIHFFTEKSMNYFCDGFEFNYYSESRFTLLKAQLLCDNKTRLSKVRGIIPFKSVLKYFLFNIYDGIYFEMAAIKKHEKHN